MADLTHTTHRESGPVVSTDDPTVLPPADVVVVTPYFGWPLISGGWQRLFHTVRGLARRYRVVLVSQHWPGTQIEEAEAFARESGCAGFLLVSLADRGEEVDPVYGVWPPARALVGDLLRSGLPRDARRWRSPDLRAALAGVRRATGADLAWSFDPGVAEDVRTAGFRAVAVDFDDVLSEVLRADIVKLGRAKRRVLYQADLLRLRAWERALPRRFAQVVLAKTEDRAMFAAADHHRLAVLPNGVRIPDPVPPAPADSTTLLFVGTLDYEPNAAAVRELLDDLMPRVWRERPDARLQIVGRGTVRWIRERVAADPRLALAENAPALRPFYEAAALVVAPVRHGSGTRNKVLEALAYQRALVSTTFAAGGCGLRGDEHLIYADDPAAFAAQCVRLLADLGARDQLSAAGRKFVAATYDWQRIEERVPDIMAAAVGAGAPGGVGAASMAGGAGANGRPAPRAG